MSQRVQSRGMLGRSGQEWRGVRPHWSWMRLAWFVWACWLAPQPALWAGVRAAKVAGRFYPGDRAELQTVVTELLDRPVQFGVGAKPRILIVPHAGYQYSGPVAAAGFRQLRGYSYDGVVVVGFTHRMRFVGASVDTSDGYETPLGEFPADREAIALLKARPGMVQVEEAHGSDEHSLEVELPFLQAVLPRAKLVAVLLGNDTLEDAERLADALADLSRAGEYLFVFSTDLSHYHPYDEANAIDEATLHAILFETPQAVHRLFQHGRLEACGQGPIVTSLLLAAKLGYPDRQLLAHATSGDTTQERARVVGYAAIAMVPRPAEMIQRMSPEAGFALARAARHELEQSLAGSATSPAEALEEYPELLRASGIFVTLRKAGQLRGCIGRIESKEPLAATVRPVALDAALRDHRFPPVAAQEVASLQIEVSVLTPPKRLSRLEELVAGRDGVILEHEGRRGVFLPQVWEETGWTRTEFLRELASQKAGLPPETWRQATLSTFQDQVFEEPLPDPGKAH